MSTEYSAVRPAGREHFPSYPKGFIAIRIVQLVIAVIILGIDAFTLSRFAWRANGLNAFTAIMTMGITIYYLVVDFSRDSWKHYNYWAVMSLDIFAIIFWLISFAIMAADIAPFADENEVCDYYGTCIWFGYILFACLAAVAGLGGVEFLLFITSLAIHTTVMHRHRAAGLHSTANNPGLSPASYNNGDIPMGSPAAVPEKQHQTFAAPAPIHPQQHYAAATPTPPPGGMPYQAPGVPQQPYYPQQQQQQVSPIGSQPQYAAPGQQVPAPHPGSYEAQGQPVGYQQH